MLCRGPLFGLLYLADRPYDYSEIRLLPAFSILRYIAGTHRCFWICGSRKRLDCCKLLFKSVL